MRASDVLAAFLVLCSPLPLSVPLSGQSELVLDAGVGAFAGGDFTDARPGPTLSVGLHIAYPDSLQGGFEVGYSRHPGMGLEGPTTQVEYLALARYPVYSSSLRVHVGGKLGYGHRSLTIVDEPATAGGFIIGPSVAARIPAGRVNIQLTLDALYETYEELILYASREYGTDEDGFHFRARLGLIFPLPSLHLNSDGP